VPPIAGLSAMLSTKPDLIPEPLTTMLGCPSTNHVVENLCQQAKFYGGKYLDVYALAQEDGAITNFAPAGSAGHFPGSLSYLAVRRSL
jgi:hypothetical protein